MEQMCAHLHTHTHARTNVLVEYIYKHSYRSVQNDHFAKEANGEAAEEEVENRKNEFESFQVRDKYHSNGKLGKRTRCAKCEPGCGFYALLLKVRFVFILERTIAHQHHTQPQENEWFVGTQMSQPKIYYTCVCVRFDMVFSPDIGHQTNKNEKHTRQSTINLELVMGVSLSHICS